MRRDALPMVVASFTLVLYSAMPSMDEQQRRMHARQSETLFFVQFSNSQFPVFVDDIKQESKPRKCVVFCHWHNIRPFF